MHQPSAVKLMCVSSICGRAHRRMRLAGRSAKRGDGVEKGAQGDVDLLNHLGKKRVVITGMGAVTAHGDDVDEMYEKLCRGESAITTIDKWDTGEIGTKFAGEIKAFDCGDYMNKKMARRVDPYIAYMIVAAKRALESAKVNWNDESGEHYVDKELRGCLIGSAMGGMQTFATATENIVTQGHSKVNPFCIPVAITN